MIKWIAILFLIGCTSEVSRCREICESSMEYKEYVTECIKPSDSILGKCITKADYLFCEECYGSF